jgi:hypothetical protein
VSPASKCSRSAWQSNRVSPHWLIGCFVSEVLATDTKAGKTQPEAVAAVLIHHDTDLYDLKITDHGKTSVIDARQVRPGRATHDYVLRALTQAFLAETVLAGGIAVTRLQAELLRPGLALTGTSKSIDEAAAEFQDFQQADPIKVERSVFLGGNW